MTHELAAAAVKFAGVALAVYAVVKFVGFIAGAFSQLGALSLT